MANGDTRRSRLLRQFAFAIAMPLAAAILAIKPSYDPLVLAAASVQESRKAAAVGRLRKEHAPPVMSFAASSALVRQVDAAAPTNIFISAEEEWMNYIAQRAKVRASTKVSFRFNSPVLMAPRIEQGAADDRPEFPPGASARRRAPRVGRPGLRCRPESMQGGSHEAWRTTQKAIQHRRDELKRAD